MRRKLPEKVTWLGWKDRLDTRMRKRPSLSGFVLTLPIRAGKVEAWRRFCQELSGSRRKLYEESRQRLGITLERMALVETAYGSTVVITLEALDLDRALGQMINSVLPFDIWYRERLQDLYGIKLVRYEQFSMRTSLPGNQELIFEWSESFRVSEILKICLKRCFIQDSVQISQALLRPGLIARALRFLADAHTARLMPSYSSNVATSSARAFTNPSEPGAGPWPRRGWRPSCGNPSGSWPSSQRSSAGTGIGA